LLAGIGVKPRWRIVLIDDDAPSTVAIAEAVESAGGAIVGKGRSAEEAALLVERCRPDVVVLAVARFREFDAVRRENEDLKKAIESRKLVERAKGLLMEREGLSESEAFRRIQKASMDSRKSMSEVAEAVLLAASVEKGPEQKPR
jgi:response regulator NasT